MKYVALLRGINVGGNNLIKMLELQNVFLDAGYTDVITYINSGNVIFSADKTDAKSLEFILSKKFNYKARVVVRSEAEISRIVANIPHEWSSRKDIRCYVGFLTDAATKEMIEEIPVREGVDSLKVASGVLYMTTDIQQLTKSGFSKMAGKKIYQEMTIRNYNTTKKIFALMN